MKKEELPGSRQILQKGVAVSSTTINFPIVYLLTSQQTNVLVTMRSERS
jgi:hypothetical protein